ncbi:two-component regulator propeller domain-containing protein [Tahibacter sp.]|uniref:two-component regulator propeller domain-containing protein n=1 Tax=Tahibacter sp. TaxID=2056211 RepID=UPI0028C4111C|nr:two-component regulator propeller domain-containing protein [Tahibacter sp.]
MRRRETAPGVARRRGGLCALFLLFAADVCLPSPAVARRVDAAAIRFQNYDAEQGLSHGRVRAIAQDRDGYIWIATRDGLNRFDGHRFRVYRHDPADPGSLPDNVVMALATTADGALWIGTAGGGLARYDAERDRFQVFRAGAATGLAGDYVRTLHADPDGDLWVGCFGVTLQRFDPRRGLARDLPLGRPPQLQRVHRVINLPDGIGVALVIAEGVVRWDGTSTTLQPLLSAAPGEVQPSTEWALLDTQRHLWVGRLDGGLLRLDLDGKVLAHYRAGPDSALRSGEVRGLLQTRAGDIWVGTSGGIARYDAASDAFVEVRHGAADASSPVADIYVLFEDRDGLVWTGSSGHGIGVHDPAGATVSVYNHRAADPDGLPVGAVQAVAIAADGTLWIGFAQDGGLVHFHPGVGVLKRYRHDPNDARSLASNTVSALAIARDGGLWVGLDAHGVDRLDPGAPGFRHYRRIGDDAGSLPGNLINDLHVDADDTLWVGSDGGGLGSLCSKCSSFHKYTIEGDAFDLSVATVTGIAETPDRAIWFGLFGGGIARLDPDRRRVRRYPASANAGAGPSSDVVRAPHASHDGSLWAGGSNGLDRIVYDADSGSARFVPQPWPDGEGSRSVTCIADDASAGLWLGTTDGLLRRGPASSSTPSRVTLLNTLDRRGYSSNACHAARDRLYLGSPRGLVVFAPQQLPPPPAIGPLLLGELLLSNAPVRPRPDDPTAVLQRTLAYTERVRLDHRHSVFGFDVSSLDYRAAAGVDYRYRLDGLHTDWIPMLPEQRSITFSGVPAGAYRFRVQARRDGSEPRETGVDVIIAPAPWRSRWAYAGYALLLLFAVGSVVRRNQQRLAYARQVAATIQRSEQALRRLNDELESRVAQRTADLSRSNRELQATLDQLRQAQRQLVEAEKLASLGGLVAGIAHEINTPLGVCLTAASHLQQQSTLLRARLAAGELRRTELDQFQQAACEGSDLILRNLQRADRLVRSFKQTAVDQSADEWRQVDLEQSVRDALVLLGPVLRLTPHHLQIECAQPVVIHASPGALYQIVSNLVLNALQHGFGDGRTGTIAIRIAHADGEAQLRICDDGRGMDAAWMRPNARALSSRSTPRVAATAGAAWVCTSSTTSSPRCCAATSTANRRAAAERVSSSAGRWQRSVRPRSVLKKFPMDFVVARRAGVATSARPVAPGTLRDGAVNPAGRVAAPRPGPSWRTADPSFPDRTCCRACRR